MTSQKSFRWFQAVAVSALILGASLPVTAGLFDARDRTQRRPDISRTASGPLGGRARRPSLREHNGASPYRGHTEALETWLKRECGHLGVQPILLERRLPDDAIQAETFACPQANH